MASALSACSAGTVSTMPTPMLKVLNISCSEMPPTFSIRWKSAGVRTSALRMRAQQPFFRLRGIFS